MKLAVRLTFAAACTLAGSPAAAAADLIITNAKVFTADPRQPYAQAVAIQGERISFVGSAAQAKSYAAHKTRIIDAGGRLLTPGLIEAHAHVGPDAPGQQVQMPRLMWPGPSPQQVIKAVRAAASTGRGWISGTIGPATLSEDRDWRSELDAASGGRPVRLRAWWGHGTILNTAAMKLLGIPEQAQDPVGGWYGRTPDGRLNGLVREQAEVIVDRQLTELVPVTASAAAIREAADRYAKWGVTSFHQMAHNYRLDAALAAIRAAKPQIKWTVYGWNWPRRSPRDAWAEFSRNRQLPPRVRVGGIKWVLDATPIERDAFLRADYSDRPGHRGRSNYSDEQLRQILATALSSPHQLALHIVGDAEARRFFAAMEELAPAPRWRSKRVRIEHGDGIAADLVPVAKRLGIVVVENPIHLLPDKDETGRPWLVNRLGEQRARDFQLLQSLLKGGIPLALGSDVFGEVANPFLNIMFASRYERNPSEALSREQALTAYSSGAAFAERQEQHKGRIAVGLKADLALLSQDILTVPIEALPATHSVLTIVDGTIVHQEAAIWKS